MKKKTLQKPWTPNFKQRLHSQDITTRPPIKAKESLRQWGFHKRKKAVQRKLMKKCVQFFLCSYLCHCFQKHDSNCIFVSVLVQALTKDAEDEEDAYVDESDNESSDEELISKAAKSIKANKAPGSGKTKQINNVQKKTPQSKEISKSKPRTKK